MIPVSPAAYNIFKVFFVIVFLARKPHPLCCHESCTSYCIYMYQIQTFYMVVPVLSTERHMLKYPPTCGIFMVS